MKYHVEYLGHEADVDGGLRFYRVGGVPHALANEDPLIQLSEVGDADVAEHLRTVAFQSLLLHGAFVWIVGEFGVEAPEIISRELSRAEAVPGSVDVDGTTWPVEVIRFLGLSFLYGPVPHGGAFLAARPGRATESWPDLTVVGTP